MYIKNFFPIALAMAVIFLPFATHAHSSETDTQPSFMMMSQIEDRIMGDTSHEEMENLMLKMISNELTEEDTNRFIQLMNQYPGSGAMMMHRVIGYGPYSMMNFNYPNYGFGYGIPMTILWVFAIIGAIATVRYIFISPRIRKS